MSHFGKLVSIASIVASPLAAHATVLPFTETFGAGGIDSYADRIVGSPQAGATYTVGAGWTPYVVLDFVTLAGAQASLWSAGYASMAWALGHGSFNVPYRIDFIPDAGWNVTLRGFDIATWSSGTYATEIRIWDDNGSFAAPNLWSFSSSLLPSTIYQPLTAPLTGTGTVRMYLSNIGSTGLDNIHFTQSPIPEPSALLLMGLGLAALAARRGVAGRSGSAAA